MLKYFLYTASSFTHYLILFAFFNLASCGCNPMHPTPTKKQQGTTIILFHGLNDEKEGKSNLEDLKNQLEKDLQSQFQQKITIIAPSRTASGDNKIELQAKEVFNKIKKENLNDKNVILVGESQGGLVAFSFYNQFKNLLQINYLITIRTPWEGTKLARISLKDFSKIFKKTMSASPLVRYIIHPYDLDWMIQSVYKDQVIRLISGDGIQDMDPNSEFLQNVKTQLSQTHLPILAIAAKKVNFEDAFQMIIENFLPPSTLNLSISNSNLTSTFNKCTLCPSEETFVKIIGAQKGDHDALITHSSQTAANISKKNKNFQVATYQGEHHFFGIKHESAIYKKIVKTIKEQL